jgi:hypothetical protein
VSSKGAGKSVTGQFAASDFACWRQVRRSVAEPGAHVAPIDRRPVHHRQRPPHARQPACRVALALRQLDPRVSAIDGQNAPAHFASIGWSLQIENTGPMPGTPIDQESSSSLSSCKHYERIAISNAPNKSTLAIVLTGCYRCSRHLAVVLLSTSKLKGKH